MSPKINIRTPEWKWLWNVTNDVTMSHSCNRIGRNGNVFVTFVTTYVCHYKCKDYKKKEGQRWLLKYDGVDFLIHFRIFRKQVMWKPHVIGCEDFFGPLHNFSAKRLSKSHFYPLSNFSGESFWSNFEKKLFSNWIKVTFVQALWKWIKVISHRVVNFWSGPKWLFSTK